MTAAHENLIDRSLLHCSGSSRLREPSSRRRDVSRSSGMTISPQSKPQDPESRLARAKADADQLAARMKDPTSPTMDPSSPSHWDADDDED
jgi:hypothetical protein